MKPNTSATPPQGEASTPAGATATETAFRGYVLDFNGKDRKKIRIHQIRLRDYETARRIANDELAITAYCTDLSPEEFNELYQCDYETIAREVRRVNESFFAYVERRNHAEREEVPHEVMQAIIERAVAATMPQPPASASAPSSPRPRLSPA